MIRNLRSQRGKKDQSLKKDQIIMCKEETEYKLYKLLEDWIVNEEKVKVTELIKFEGIKRNKQQYKCQGHMTFDCQNKWILIEGVSIINSDETLYIVDLEIYSQAIRSLINEEKAVIERNQKYYDDNDDNEDELPKKKSKKNIKQNEEFNANQVEEDEESNDSYSSAEEDPVPKKQRLSRKKEEKDQKKGKQKSKKFRDIYKNLKKECAQFEGTEDHFLDRLSIKANNKEVIRAAQTGNKKLMEDIFAKKWKISCAQDSWGPELDITPVEILLKRQDKELLSYYLQNRSKVVYGHNQPCTLKEINTGYNNRYAYGVRLRKVALGRGNREGNNAFVYDLGNDKPDYQFQKLLEIETDPQLYELFFLHCKNENYESQLIENVSKAVRCGNWKTAKFLINYSIANNEDGYGFNYLHHDAFGDNFSTYKLAQIKKISITKKTSNDFLITPIHCACINPSEQFLKYFLEQTMEYNCQDEIGRKPVHYAAASQTSNCLEYLLANGVDGREGDKYLMTPVMIAAKYGRAHNIKLLLNTNLKGKNKEGNSAIHLASQNGHTECVKILIENGVLINIAGKNRMTPLHFACAYNHMELVEYLLDEGARINSKDKFGRTPLIMAARNGNLTILSKLIYYGADVTISDSSKNSAIHHAAAYGFIECIENLIEVNVDQNQFNSWKLTPLNVALAKNHFGIVKSLLKYESTDVNCIDDDGLTLIGSMVKQFNSTLEQYEFIQFLITEKKADINIQDKYGKTCIQHALLCRQSELQVELVKLLLENGADINIKDKDGRTCLLHILGSQQSQIQTELVKLLLQKGANINSQEKENGQSGFSLCLKQRNYSLIQELLNVTEVDVNLVNNEDKTFLHIMIENQFYYDPQAIQIFEIILNKIKSSLINFYDQDGFVPLLRLVHNFVQSIASRIQQDFDQKVEKRKKEIWDQIVQEYKSKEEEFKNILQNNPSANPIYAFQKEIEQRLAKAKQICHASRYSYEKIYAQVGLTQEEVQEFNSQKVDDGYRHQNNFFETMKLLISKGADTAVRVIKQKWCRDLEKETSSLQNSNVFHIAFQFLPSVSFVTELQNYFPKYLLYEHDIFGQPVHYFFQNYKQYQVILERSKKETSEIFFQYLITLGLDFTEKNSVGNTPTLMIAYKFEEGYVPLLEKLVSLGGKINDVNNSNVVPLHKFVSQSNIKYVKSLVQKFKLDPNYQDMNGRTALHYATNFSNPNANASFQMEQILIKSGAKCNIRDIYNRTPLFYAFTKFDNPKSTQEIDPFESVSSLLAYDECEVNALDIYGRSPLHYAALRGSAISGRYMIKMGAKIDEPDNFNNTPLAYAFFAHSNFSTMLIDNKANVNKLISIISETDFKAEKYKIYQEQVRNDREVDRLMKLEDQEINTKLLKLKQEERSKQLEKIQKEMQQDDNKNDQISEESDNDGQTDNKIREQQPIIFRRRRKDKIIQRKKIIEQLVQEKLKNDIDIPQHLHNQLATGKYSYFSQAIKFGWQGVAYLLISDGYEFVKAIQDAINANQFQLVLTLLMKVKNITDVQRLDEKGQNLFHLFAKYSSSVNFDLKQEIIEEFEAKQISPYLQDINLKTPFHYAAENQDQQLINYFLLKRKCDPNIMDSTQNNPFTILLQKNYSQNFYNFIENGLKIDVQFQVLANNKLMKPFMFLVNYRKLINVEVLQTYIKYGVDINEQNEECETIVTMAIQSNNISLLKFILDQPSFKKESHAIDQNGKSPIHHAVLPLEFGSYENLNILRLLTPIFDYNTQDNKGLTPLDYALIFDAQIMKDELLSLNAHHTRSLRQQRMPTSIISTALWPDQVLDFEEDAHQYQGLMNMQLEPEIDNKEIVDKSAIITKGDLIVYEDPEYGLFQCLMSKVDIVNKNFHKNVFYKMQILLDQNRNNYILFTKWGQIGEEGQFQMTPFENLEATIKEYCKIFSAKTGGNNWKLIKRGEQEFEKKPGKYQLMQFSNNVSYKTFLKPFDLSDKSPYPKCLLHQSIQTVIEQFSQVKLYQQELQNYHFDTSFVPLEKLNKTVILKAKEYLLELKEIVKELEEYMKLTDQDLKRLQQFYSEINEKSARYYELIPQTQMRQNVLPLLENDKNINQQLQLVEVLLNVELSVKILLGAHFKADTIHPLAYCFNALNIKMLTLTKDDLEYKMIKTYMGKTQTVKISNIFAIERKGEAKKFEQFNNGPRMLLWHGSKISNFISLMALGLKIAPSWAVNTGALYGKGIYFADQFAKSYNYTTDSTIRQGNNNWRSQLQYQNLQKYRYLLLCEVSCTNQVDLYNYHQQDISTYFKPEITLRVVGSQGPDSMSQIKLPNGCVVPIGNLVSQPFPDHLKEKLGHQNGFKTAQTEYIIYDESRVRIRYLVQIEQ
ncbi:unnamed protein product [Paramecium octaurelia]|uniref:Poly [ADP-ribose] polymerase n=1 Tax=Paramecium octaurelia TaxID=43137 RepID=A0A8S1SCI2_PAROT|nr:unnamed protein product [Paramecium octaurelia]